MFETGDYTDDEPETVAVLSPNPLASIPEILFIGGFFGVWAGGFFGVLSMIVVTAVGLGAFAGALPFVIGGSAFVGMIAWQYLTVKSITYTVTEDGVEKEKGVASTSITSVRFDDVTDAHYSQSFLDGVFGVGTVKLNTAGSNAKALKLKHIPDSRDVYESLDSKIRR